jgi:hypothetical protein
VECRVGGVGKGVGVGEGQKAEFVNGVIDRYRVVAASTGECFNRFFGGE